MNFEFIDRNGQNILSLVVYIPAPTLSLNELLANFNTALAACSGTETASDVSPEPVDSCGAIEVAGTEKKDNTESHHPQR